MQHKNKVWCFSEAGAALFSAMFDDMTIMKRGQQGLCCHGCKMEKNKKCTILFFVSYICRCNDEIFVPLDYNNNNIRSNKNNNESKEYLFKI